MRMGAAQARRPNAAAGVLQSVCMANAVHLLARAPPDSCGQAVCSERCRPRKPVKPHLWRLALAVFCNRRLAALSIRRDLLALQRAALDECSAARPHQVGLYAETTQWGVDRKLKVHDEAYARASMAMEEIITKLTPLLGPPHDCGDFERVCWLMVSTIACQWNPAYLNILGETKEAHRQASDLVLPVITFSALFRDARMKNVDLYLLRRQIALWVEEGAKRLRPKLHTLCDGQHAMGVQALLSLWKAMLCHPPAQRRYGSAEQLHLYLTGLKMQLGDMRTEKVVDSAINLGLVAGSASGSDSGFTDAMLPIDIKTQGHALLVIRLTKSLKQSTLNEEDVQQVLRYGQFIWPHTLVDVAKEEVCSLQDSATLTPAAALANLSLLYAPNGTKLMQWHKLLNRACHVNAIDVAMAAHSHIRKRVRHSAGVASPPLFQEPIRTREVYENADGELVCYVRKRQMTRQV